MRMLSESERLRMEAVNKMLSRHKAMAANPQTSEELDSVIRIRVRTQKENN